MALLTDKICYTYNDVSIVPAKASIINHRDECNTRYEDGMLPIFTAPMNCIVDESNFDTFEKNGIHAILPRTEDFLHRVSYALSGKWAAFSIKEASDYFLNENKVEPKQTIRVLIDVANGHMISLYDVVSEMKKLYGDKIEIMVGNIANPETYLVAAKAGADYVRCGVGAGSGCFVEGTQITMADGTKRNIEDIDKGDFVLTINGPQKVTNTFIKNKQDTITINDDIECTTDHKFFVVRKTDVTEEMTEEEIKEKGFYIEAQYLCEDYLLVMV